MFARFMEITVKPEKKAELTMKLREEILPIMKKYNSFYDLVQFNVEADPTKVMIFSLWHQKLESDNFVRDHFGWLSQIIEPLLTEPLVVKNCNVETTLSEKVFGLATAA